MLARFQDTSVGDELRHSTFPSNFSVTVSSKDAMRVEILAAGKAKSFYASEFDDCDFELVPKIVSKKKRK